MEGQCKHLKQEDFVQFIEQGLEGYTWGPVERHFVHCPECLRKLELILQLGAPTHRPFCRLLTHRPNVPER